MSSHDNSPFSARQILDGIAGGVYVTDRERRIVFWNATAERITGWRAEQVMGRHCFDGILDHADNDGHKLCGEEFCPLHRAIATGRNSTAPMLVFLQTESGDRVPVQVSVAPLRDAEGTVVGGVETFLPLTELWADLRRARQVQRSAIETALPQDPRAQCRVHYVPHDLLGGDFYRVTRLDADRFAFIVADVMGHGVSSALFTMQLRLLWDDSFDLLARPEILLGSLNRRLCPLLGEGSSFVTALAAVLDLTTLEVRYSVAGHPPAIRFTGDGVPSLLVGAGVPLGITHDPEYVLRRAPVRQGDTLLCYTDGACDRIRCKEREGAAESLIALLCEIGYPHRVQGLDQIEEQVLARSEDVRLADDLTLLEWRLTAAR